MSSQILFREYGWPAKLAAQATYRDLQLGYNMDDYSSKGSRVVAVKKTHRNLQVGLTEGSVEGGKHKHYKENVLLIHTPLTLRGISSLYYE